MKFEDALNEIAGTKIGKIFDNDIFIYPQLNLFLIMSDEWRILGSIK